jgi:hypothetical protein
LLQRNVLVAKSPGFRLSAIEDNLKQVFERSLPHLVMRRHHQMRQQALCGWLRRQGRVFADDAVGPEIRQQFKLGASGRGQRACP